MPSYKVAQDVEADDKLLGPFSFRQFIYLIIVAMAGLVAWGLGSLLLPLAILPMPIILFFGALALPLKKDQPMETYLAAMISFYLKPRKRLWMPDGVQSLVEITAPQTDEIQLTKNISENEASRRLAYLASLSDSQGWSIRNTTMPSDDSPMRADVYNEARQTEDPLDDDGSVARAFESRILQTDTRNREELLARMSGQNHGPSITTPPIQQQSPVSATYIVPPMDSSINQPTNNQYTQTNQSSQQYQAQSYSQTPVNQTIQFNPYPTSIRQTVIQPMSADDHATANLQPYTPGPTPQSSPPPQTTTDEEVDDSSTSATTPTPDIIKLASNENLSVEAIAREAKRLEASSNKDTDDEVVISLR